jgi:hypothetical protein
LLVYDNSYYKKKGLYDRLIVYINIDFMQSYFTDGRTEVKQYTPLPLRGAGVLKIIPDTI